MLSSVGLDSSTVSRPNTHPRLNILGPTQLLHAVGAQTRDPRRCLEYAVYLLEHPGTSTHQLADVFTVTTATVRTVITYLRSWLGLNPDDGLAYLPLAYRGGYRLHDDISSDWEDVQLLTTPSPHQAGEDHLVATLCLVRGAPFADGHPGEWRWAEELRTEAASRIRDVAHELAVRALDRNDVDRARWAASRGLVANPEDEQLLLARLRTERQAGATLEAHRIASRLRGNARRNRQPLSAAAAALVVGA